MLPGRGPGRMAPPVPAGRLLRRAPRPSVVSWPLVRTSRPALAAGPLPLGAVGRARGRRPRGSLACPPLRRSARVRAVALRGRSLPPSGSRLAIRSGCGLPVVALAPLRRGCSQRVGRGGPLRARCAASAPVAPRSAPVARPLGRAFFRGGCALAARVRLRPLASLPASPPPLPPRWGSRGARGLRPECRFSRPSRGCAAGCVRPPVRRFRCSCHS